MPFARHAFVASGGTDAARLAFVGGATDYARLGTAGRLAKQRGPRFGGRPARVSNQPQRHARGLTMVAPMPNPPRAVRQTAAREALVDIYDTTLRDGTQGEGISLSVADKLKIAHSLDEFGVSYIEGGWPGSNPKDERFFELCTDLQIARLVAFGSTRYKDTTCDGDRNVQALLASNTPVVTLVGKTWDMQVSIVLETSLDENVAMIRDTVSYFKQLGREVMLDAEHFFDGYRASPDYAIRCLRAAVKAGVDVLVLCDTNGGSLPWEVERVTRAVALEFPDARVGIHCHNDMELAVANSLAAVHGGATLVQGTVNGYGERTGNANLTSIVPALQLKMQRGCIRSGVEGLTKLSRFVEETANQRHVPSRPFVGASSFAHKGGLHASAVLKDERTYQHIDPAAVGNVRRVIVSELAGRKNIISKAQELRLVSDNAELGFAKQVLAQVKELEAKGYSFEGAEASVELMIRRAMPDYRPPFQLLDFTVITGNKHASATENDGYGPHDFGSDDSSTQATIKVELIGPKQPGSDVEACPSKKILNVGEGNGPVDAFNNGLRKLLEVYEPLKEVTLVDYKVRILDNENACAATTRVMIDFKDRATGRRWTCVSVHENIILASVTALVDGYEFAMIHKMPQCIL